MINYKGNWIPDDETYIQSFLDLSPYHDGIIEAALIFCREQRVALDLGANCGLISKQLVPKFKWVNAFEPVSEFGQCFKRNLEEYGNWTLYPYALGAREGPCAMERVEGNCGMTHVSMGDGNGAMVQMIPLDQYYFDCVDLLKIDVEGMELEVFKGAEKTIMENQPVIMLEDKHASRYGNEKGDCLKWLKERNYVVAAYVGADYICISRG